MVVYIVNLCTEDTGMGLCIGMSKLTSAVLNHSSVSTRQEHARLSVYSAQYSAVLLPQPHFNYTCNY